MGQRSQAITKMAAKLKDSKHGASLAADGQATAKGFCEDVAKMMTYLVSETLDVAEVQEFLKKACILIGAAVP